MLCILTLKKVLLVYHVMSSQRTRKWCLDEKIKQTTWEAIVLIVHSSLSRWRAVSRLLQLPVQLQVERDGQSSRRQLGAQNYFDKLEKSPGGKKNRISFSRDGCKVQSLGRNKQLCKGRQGNSQVACPWKGICKLLRIKPEVNIIVLLQNRRRFTRAYQQVWFIRYMHLAEQEEPQLCSVLDSTLQDWNGTRNIKKSG